MVINEFNSIGLSASELNLNFNFSSNLTNEGSPFLLSGDQAEEVLTKATDGGEAEPTNQGSKYR